MATTAIRRALETGSRPGMLATEWATGTYTTGLVASQKRAISVCSGVRWELVQAPKAFPPLKTRAQVALFRVGGGPGRNWSQESSSHGFRCAHGQGNR